MCDVFKPHQWQLANIEYDDNPTPMTRHATYVCVNCNEERTT